MKLSDYEQREKHAFTCVRIRLLRQVLGLSVEELAAEAGITPEDVIAAEKGDISKVDKQFEIVLTYTEKYGGNKFWLVNGKGNVFFERGSNVSYQFYEENVELFDCVSPYRFSTEDAEAFIPTRFPRLNKILNFFRSWFIKRTIRISQLAEFKDRELHTLKCARIKVVRELLGLTVEVLAQEAGITPEDVIAVENGDDYASEDCHMIKILEVLFDNYGVSITRLITGKGHVFLERGPKVSYQFYRENVGLYSGVSSKHYPELDDEEEKPPKSPLPAKTAKTGITKKREGVPA